MWTLLQMVKNGMIQEAKLRAAELGIVQIEVFKDSNPNRNRFYLAGLRIDKSGMLFSFCDMAECLLAGELLSRHLELPFINGLDRSNNKD